MSLIQIILIALIAIISMGVIVVFAMSQEAKRKERAVLAIKGRSGGVKISDKDDANKRRAEIAKKLKDSKSEDPNKKKKTISMAISQAGLKISTTQFWIFSAISMIALVLIAKMMGQAPFVLLMAAVIGFFGVPRYVLKIAAGKRQKKFLEEFPDALEATVRLLRAGMPVSEAVSMIAKEFTGPVGEEMSIIYDKQRIGIPLHEAALEATRRMPLPEMQMFATGLAIQAQTGSSLSEVLMNLSGVIRARFRLKRKVKALSSEAIASASIIAALPNLVAIGMYFANREYITILFTDPFGKVLLAGSVIWMCMGVLVMRAMINFKI